MEQEQANAMVEDPVLENSTSSSSNLELRVRSLNSPDVSVNVEVDCLVGDLKTILVDRTSIPKTQQRLIYKGKVLQDDIALSTYHVESGHTLHLVPRQGDHPADSEGAGGSPSNNGDQRQSNGGDAAGRPWGQMPVIMNIPGREGAESQGNDGPWARPTQSPHLSALLAALGGPVVAGEQRSGSTAQGGTGLLNAIPPQASRVISGLFQGADRIGINMQNSGEGPGGTAPQGPIAWPSQGPHSRDIARGEEDSSSHRVPRGNGGGDLEHIRQGLLTVQTLLQAMRDRVVRSGGRQEERPNQSSVLQELREEVVPSDSRESDVVDTESPAGDTTVGTELPERESQAGDNMRDNDEEMEVVAEESPASLESSSVAPRRHFFVGQWLDVKDTVNQWLEATVMDIRYPEDGDGPSELLIHYNGWPEQWDEWIPCNSVRLAPFCTRTTWDIHRANTFSNSGGPNGGTGQHLSPTTYYERDDNAPTTGSDDIRVLLPQVARLVSEVLPAMQTVVGSFEQGIVRRTSDDAGDSTGEVRGGRRLRQRQLSWQQNQFQDENVDPHRSELPQETGMLAQDLAPLLDRLGRILSDVAPALANLGRSSSYSQGDDEGGRRSIVSSHSQSSRTDDILSPATAPGHERRVRGRYDLSRRGPSVRRRQLTGHSLGNREEARSPSPDSSFRRLVHSGGGSIDIHIHAIMPLRPNVAPVAAARSPVSTAEEGGGVVGDRPSTSSYVTANPSPNGDGAAEEEGTGDGSNVQHVGGRTTLRTTAGGNSAVTSVSGGVGANASALRSMSSPAHGVLFTLPLDVSTLGGSLGQAQQQSRSGNDDIPSEPAAAGSENVENISPIGAVTSTPAHHIETTRVTPSEAVASESHYDSLQAEIADSTSEVSALRNEGIDTPPLNLAVPDADVVQQNEEEPSPVPRDNEGECLNEQGATTTTILSSVSSAAVDRSSWDTTETNSEIPHQYPVASTGNNSPRADDGGRVETLDSNCEMTVEASHSVSSLEEQDATFEQDIHSPSSIPFASSPHPNSRWRWFRRNFLFRQERSGQRG